MARIVHGHNFRGRRQQRILHALRWQTDFVSDSFVFSVRSWTGLAHHLDVYVANAKSSNCFMGARSSSSMSVDPSGVQRTSPHSRFLKAPLPHHCREFWNFPHKPRFDHQNRNSEVWILFLFGELIADSKPLIRTHERSAASDSKSLSTPQQFIRDMGREFAALLDLQLADIQRASLGPHQRRSVLVLGAHFESEQALYTSAPLQCNWQRFQALVER